MIYEDDYKELCAWVLKKPNIETGGDLFGLWADKHTAVIQLVLGPGKQCTRTSTSFYQDIDYLGRVGSYLTQNEGVCHIGEWHSHHQLGLARPSGGDENTVWNNMPTYNLKRFVIFIANIQSSKHSYNVNVGCFLFEIDDQGKHMNVLPGKFTMLQKNSPLSKKIKVTEERKKGAEKDDENEIAIKELTMETNKGDKRPSVTYSKPKPAPIASERKRGNRGNHSQLENQNKPNDEESSTDKKKRKMNTEEKSTNKTPGNGKESPEGSPPSEDLKNLTINNEQPEEKSEEAMKQEEEKEQPMRNSQEEINNEQPEGKSEEAMEQEEQKEQPMRNSQEEINNEQPEEKSEEAMEQEEEKEQPVRNSQEEIKHEDQHDDESGKSRGKKAGKIEEGNEDCPPQADQGKTEKEGKQRPLPELGPETTPGEKTQKQKEDVDEETIKEQDEKERQEKKNQEEFKHGEQHEGEEEKSRGGRKAENIKGKAGCPQAEQGEPAKESKPRPLPKPKKETKPEAKTQKKKDQDKETAKARASQSGAKKAASPSQTASTKSTKKQK